MTTNALTNALTTFTFANDDVKAPVRVVEIDGNPWFVASDVCRALGFDMSKGAGKYLGNLSADQKRQVSRANYPEIFGGDRAPSHTLISEGGLYDKVLSAHKVNPKARAFRKWVTDEVLPAIRKDGMYVMGEEKVRTGEMSEDELVLKAMTLLQAKVERLRQENEKLHHERDNLSIDAFRAFITKGYWTHGFKVKLAKKAAEIARSRRVALQREGRTIRRYGQEIPVAVNIYPRQILEEAYRLLAA